jgi:hypothetical protein
MCLVTLDGTYGLNPALLRPSASRLPLTFVPEGLPLLFDNAREHAKLTNASPSDASLWSVRTAVKLSCVSMKENILLFFLNAKHISDSALPYCVF